MKKLTRIIILKMEGKDVDKLIIGRNAFDNVIIPYYKKQGIKLKIISDKEFKK